MFKILVLAAVVYFVYRFVWRDNSLNGTPPRPKIQDSPFRKEEIEDTEFTEKK